MIKANELRIGNLILSADKTECRVLAIDVILSIEALKDKRQGDLNAFDIYGIHLTEEWLVKFGFEQCKPSNQFRMDEDLILQWSSLDESYYVYYKNELAQITEIQFVHQLQNLYFALTGEELILKS